MDTENTNKRSGLNLGAKEMAILLIIGNGFSTDLCQYLKLNINPSSPFRFDVLDPFESNRKLLDTLTRVKKIIEENPKKGDFDIVQDFVRNHPRNKEDAWVHCELRHYFALAYSHLYEIVLSGWKKDWRWQRWIERNYTEISGVFTLNYDLILETTLNKSSLNYYRIGSTEEDQSVGIPIFKPHGSCDFDISNRAISMTPEIRLKNLTFLNDYVVNGKGRIQIVPKSNLMEPRTEADIVLPFEFSPQTKLTWVRQGYRTMEQIAETVDTIVIVGISYQPCDRHEVNAIIEKIPKNSEIKLVDLNPNVEFVEKLERTSGRVRIIDPDNPAGFFS
jgi:hypothetical protein